MQEIYLDNSAVDGIVCTAGENARRAETDSYMAGYVEAQVEIAELRARCQEERLARQSAIAEVVSVCRLLRDWARYVDGCGTRLDRIDVAVRDLAHADHFAKAAKARADLRAALDASGVEP